MLARKGEATPAVLPLPAVPAAVRVDYVDAPAPAREESCCGGAAAARVRTAIAQRAADQDAHPEIDHRTHVSVRLNPDQLRRLKTAAAQLHLSQQRLLADGLELYLDKLAVEELAGCRCLKAKT
jgi:hypothetical protein